MEQSEREWISAYRRGDMEALGRLVEHFRRPLMSFISRMLEGHADAEDVFQEVWYRAVRNFSSYRDDRFISWLFRIAHNLVIDRARKRKPIVELPSENDENPIEERLADAGVRPDGAASGKDVGVRIREAVQQLPPEQREVFLLRMEGDVPFKDIARMQGVSINTALARMQYALAKLRAGLRTDYESLGR